MAATYIPGPFRRDAETDTLFRGGEPVSLGHRAVALLRVLVEQRGIPVSKDAHLTCLARICRGGTHEAEKKQRRRPSRGWSEPAADAAKSTPVSRPDWQLQSRLRTRMGRPPGIAPASAQGSHRAAPTWRSFVRRRFVSIRRPGASCLEDFGVALRNEEPLVRPC